ncbi:5878_t:CDS:2, partial [Racocetra fulgida]
GVLSHQQCIINTNGDEVDFTDAVPYIRTSAYPMEDENAVSVQVDIYDIPDIKPCKYPNRLHHDPMEITVGSDTE